MILPTSFAALLIGITAGLAGFALYRVFSWANGASAAALATLAAVITGSIYPTLPTTIVILAAASTALISCSMFEHPQKPAMLFQREFGSVIGLVAVLACTAIGAVRFEDLADAVVSESDQESAEFIKASEANAFALAQYDDCIDAGRASTGLHVTMTNSKAYCEARVIAAASDRGGAAFSTAVQSSLKQLHDQRRIMGPESQMAFNRALIEVGSRDSTGQQ